MVNHSKIQLYDIRVKKIFIVRHLGDKDYFKFQIFPTFYSAPSELYRSMELYTSGFTGGYSYLALAEPDTCGFMLHTTWSYFPIIL
jgi:hypothetical protein